MAVEHRIEPLLKSAPDVNKLNAFSGTTVTVTKHTAPRNTTGQMVVPTGPMPLRQILELQSSIPLQYGPGFYRFAVVDTGGSGSDEWMVRLGAEVQQQEVQMAGPIGVIPSSGMQPPVGEGVVHLGHGFYYNGDLGTLTTPWRGVYNWKQGDPMPTQPTSASTAAAATPFQSAWPAAPGWGSYPVNDTESSRVKLLEAQLAEQNRKIEMDGLRADMRRQQEETTKQITALVDKLTTVLAAKPVQSDEVIVLRNELAEQRRRNEEADREQRRREEERRSEEGRRQEMQTLNDKFDRTIRELSSNKQDPMLPLIMQMLSATQAQAQETVRAIQASTTETAAASERSTQELVRQLSGSILQPMQLVQLLQSAKGDGAEMARMMVEATKETMSLQKSVYEQLLDVAGQNGQPAWVPIAQEALNRIGVIGQAMMQRQQQAPQPQPVRAPLQRPMVAAPAPMQALPQTQAQAPTNGASQAQAQAPTNGAMTTEMNGAEGKGKKNGAGHRGRGKGKKDTGVVADVTQGANVIPIAPAAPQGYSIAQLQEMSPEIIRETVAPISDNDLFGELYPYVEQLRAAPPAAAEVVKYVLQGRAFLLQKNAIMPPAIELLEAEQLEVFSERLFPGAPSAYRVEVVDALEEAMGLDDDGEEDETEEDQAR